LALTPLAAGAEPNVARDEHSEIISESDRTGAALNMWAKGQEEEDITLVTLTAERYIECGCTDGQNGYLFNW